MGVDYTFSTQHKGLTGVLGGENADAIESECSVDDGGGGAVFPVEASSSTPLVQDKLLEPKPPVCDEAEGSCGLAGGCGWESSHSWQLVGENNADIFASWANSDEHVTLFTKASRTRWISVVFARDGTFPL